MSLIDQSTAQPEVKPAPAATETTTTEGQKPEAEKVTTEAQPEVAKTEEEKAAAASEAGKALAARKQSFQERMNERTRELHAMERRATEAERKLAELQGRTKAPDPAQYDDMAKLNADQVGYTLDQRDADRLKSESKAARDEANAAVAEVWNERAAAFKADVPDFEEVAYRAPIDPQSAALIARMDEGPAIAYYLGKNPSEARQIKNLSERDKAIELGRLAGRLSQQPVRRTTQAPSPIVNGVTGKSAGGSAKIADLPFDDYAKLVATEMGGKR